MPIVYVTQDNGNKNLVPAMQLGTIKVLAQRDLPLHGNPGNALAKLRTSLKDFNVDEDYLVLAGDPLLIGAAVTFVSQLSREGKVRCLKWDRQCETYVFIEIPLGSQPKQHN